MLRALNTQTFDQVQIMYPPFVLQPVIHNLSFVFPPSLFKGLRLREKELRSAAIVGPDRVLAKISFDVKEVG